MFLSYEATFEEYFFFLRFSFSSGLFSHRSIGDFVLHDILENAFILETLIFIQEA